MKTFATIIAVSVLALSPSAAEAAPGVVADNVNVRIGPGIHYAAADILMRGEIVDVDGCRAGWCYVRKNGPDGWVAESYLSPMLAGRGVGFHVYPVPAPGYHEPAWPTERRPVNRYGWHNGYDFQAGAAYDERGWTAPAIRGETRMQMPAGGGAGCVPGTTSAWNVC